jgi:hypothetical protein
VPTLRLGAFLGPSSQCVRCGRHCRARAARRRVLRATALGWTRALGDLDRGGDAVVAPGWSPLDIARARARPRPLPGSFHGSGLDDYRGSIHEATFHCPARGGHHIRNARVDRVAGPSSHPSHPLGQARCRDVLHQATSTSWTGMPFAKPAGGRGVQRHSVGDQMRMRVVVVRSFSDGSTVAGAGRVSWHGRGTPARG